ncbi:hypothetical protein FOA52_005376 [Chlamydomonas sp. UWO 241]|nr:hypothetical protein FOA52_005376 [Chlamydomonas sp. UWO 241]
MEDADEQEGGGVGSSVAALIENVQREVGIAVFSPASCMITLVQYIEAGRSYSTTALMLATHDVGTAVLVASAAQRRAFAAGGLAVAVDSMDTHALPRRSFDDTRGLESIMACCTEESQAALSHAQVHASHYLALGAAGALLEHLSAAEAWGRALAGTMKVVVQGTDKHMLLDAGSVASLELVRPSCGPVRAGNGNGPPRSLLELLHRTRTGCGSRLLRSSLLQPLTDIPTLEARYDCLETLLESEQAAVDIAYCLAALPKDLDRMCSSIALKRARTGNPGCHIGCTTTALILLRSVLRALPGLVEALEGAGVCCLLDAIHDACALPEFTDMLALMEEVIDPEAQVSKVPFMNRIQQCFAIKPGADPMLELARSAFGRTTELIHELAAGYQQQHYGLQVKASYSAKRGFYLAISPAKAADRDGDGGGRYHGGRQQDSGRAAALPRDFIVVEKRARGVTWCTTHELNALNNRLQDAATSCLELAEEVLDALVSELVANMPLMQRLIDAVALLDVMLAFSQVVGASRDSYVRPQLSAGGPLAVVQGRHPVLEGALASEPGGFQPNDTYISEACCLHIVTGPTMAGKSTYLKQVALLVVLAQAGSYVPARFMSFSPFSRLFTRMGTSDSIETNSSSFMVEMQEVAHILQHAGPRSLVVIDELGRATSTCDGVAIAWAVCERLASTRCFTLLATHLRQLAGLAQLHPCVKLWELSVHVAPDARLDFLRTLRPANSLAYHHHGLIAAGALGMPSSVLAEAGRVARRLEAAECSASLVPGAAGACHVVGAVLSLAARLQVLAQQNPWCWSSEGGGEGAAGVDAGEASGSGRGGGQSGASAGGRDWEGLRSLLDELHSAAAALSPGAGAAGTSGEV